MVQYKYCIVNKPVLLVSKKEIGHWGTEGIEYDWQKEHQV